MAERYEWDGGRIVALFEGLDWKLGVADDYSPQKYLQAIQELQRLGVVVESGDDGLHSIDEEFIWFVLTSEGDMWEGVEWRH